MSNQSTNEAGTAEADERAQRARARRARDEQWLNEATQGDANAYRHLVDEWAPGAFDRALHRGADERSAGDAVLHTFTSLQGELTEPDTSFGARVLGTIERDVPARPRALGKANRGAKRAAERLTRGTDPAAVGADPSISVMLWDALEVLGDRARDITDLHWRHGLASDEIAAATGESIFRVDDIIRKAPQGLAAALRTRLLWAGGKPDHDELTKDLKANSVHQFDSLAVRVIHQHLRACSVCRSRSLIALPAIEVFANVPLVAIPGEVERRISGTTWAPGRAAAGGVGAALASVATTPDPSPDLDSDVEAVDESPATPAPEPTPAPDPTPAAPTPAASVLDERARKSARTGAAAAGTTAAAGAAAAAFLAPKAAADAPPDVFAPPPAEPDVAPAADIPTLEPKLEPAPISAPEPLPTMPLTALMKTPSEPTPPAPPTPQDPPTPQADGDAGSTHEPVASRVSERDDGGRPKWLIPAGIAAAAVLVLGLIVVLTRGGDNPTAIDTGPTVESTTTTRAPSSTTTTTRAPSTTASTTPSTQASPSTTAGGGGGGGGNVVTTTTKPPTIIATVNQNMSPGTIRKDAPGSSFSWSVTANGPVTVSVTGPGVSSSDLSGAIAVCLPGSSCHFIGTHYFSIVVKDSDGRQVGAGTAKLTITD